MRNSTGPRDVWSMCSTKVPSLLHWRVAIKATKQNSSSHGKKRTCYSLLHVMYLFDIPRTKYIAKRHYIDPLIQWVT
jgi:hypothetical protein